MRRTRLAALTTVAALALLGLVPASALALGQALALRPTAGPPTTLVTANGIDFTPGSGVTVTFDTTVVATATANSTGGFTVKFAVPLSAQPGSHTVTAQGSGTDQASATFDVESSWGLQHFGLMASNFNPYENVLSPSNAGSLSELTNSTFGGSVRSEPIYVGGEIFVGGTDGTVRSFNVNGAQLWSFSTQAPVVGSPAYPPDPCHVLVAGSQDGHLYGINANTGTKAWSFAGDGGFSASPVELVPAVQKGEGVLAVSDNGTVYAVNACNGNLIWSDSTAQSGPPTDTAVLTAAVASDGTTHSVVAVGIGNTIFAFDAASGKQLWTASESVPISAGPAAYGSGKSARVLIGDGSSVIELNGGTGGFVWLGDTPAPVSGIGLYGTTSTNPNGTLRATLQSVIAGDQAGDLYSMKLANGTINWGDSEPGAIQGAPAIANGVIYLTTGPGPSSPGALVAVRATDGGGLLVSDELNPQPYPPGPPSITDGKVFVGDFDASLSIFGLSAG